MTFWPSTNGPLVGFSLTTFLVATLVFPVATTWGTFLHAAGAIHSDIQKGFVRAEIIGWEALVEAGGYAGARAKGTLRLEGRDYVMHDGDVITVRFTP